MDIEGFPQNKEELLANIAQEWNALQKVIERLGPEQALAPDAGGWSPKDNLAHIGAWEQFMIRRYLQGQPSHEAMQIGEETLKHLEEDDLNQILFDRNQPRSLAEVLEQVNQTHAELLATLEQMPFEELMRPYPTDPQHRPTIIWVMGNSYQHYQEHRQTIEANVDR